MTEAATYGYRVQLRRFGRLAALVLGVSMIALILPPIAQAKPETAGAGTRVAIGDSVMLGAAGELKASGFAVVAAESRGGRVQDGGQVFDAEASAGVEDVAEGAAGTGVRERDDDY